MNGGHVRAQKRKERRLPNGLLDIASHRSSNNTVMACCIWPRYCLLGNAGRSKYDAFGSAWQKARTHAHCVEKRYESVAASSSLRLMFHVFSGACDLRCRCCPRHPGFAFAASQRIAGRGEAGRYELSASRGRSALAGQSHGSRGRMSYRLQRPHRCALPTGLWAESISIRRLDESQTPLGETLSRHDYSAARISGDPTRGRCSTWRLTGHCLSAWRRKHGPCNAGRREAPVARVSAPR